MRKYDLDLFKDRVSEEVAVAGDGTGCAAGAIGVAGGNANPFEMDLAAALRLSAT